MSWYTLEAQLVHFTCLVLQIGPLGVFCFLFDSSKSAHITVQWIPAHCDLVGNERADKLAKSGSKMEQTNHTVSYREAKTLVK